MQPLNFAQLSVAGLADLFLNLMELGAAVGKVVELGGQDVKYDRHVLLPLKKRRLRVKMADMASMANRPTCCRQTVGRM